MSATIGDFQRFWVHSWQKNHTTPTAVLNNAHMDFTKRYAKFKDGRISGVWKTDTDPKTANSFKISWSPKGDGVEVLFKQYASDLRFLGTDHQPDSPGFFMLPNKPFGRPDIIPGGKKQIMKKDYIREVTSKSMQKVIASHVGDKVADASIQWLKECATTGQIPFTYKHPEDQISQKPALDKSKWGVDVLVGVEDRKGDFVLMKDDYEGNTNEDLSGEEFWKLPDDIQAQVDVDIREALEAKRKKSGTPNVRYTRVTKQYAQDIQQVAAKKAKNDEKAVRASLRKKITSPSVSATENRSSTPKRRRLNDAEFQAAAESDEEFDPTKEIEFDGVSSEPDDDRGVIQPQETQWGAPFTECKIGCLAIVHTDFQDGSGGIGVELYKVKAMTEGVGEGSASSFTGIPHVPSKEGVMVTSEECLKCKWHSNKTLQMETVLSWQVLHYFSKFTKGRCIPKVDQKAVHTKAEKHCITLFETPAVREIVNEYEAYMNQPADADEGEDEDEY